MNRGVLIGLALAAGIGTFLLVLAIGVPAQGPSCRIVGSGAFTAPDNSCTPGRWAIRGASEARRREFVCSSKPRPGLSVFERRRLLSEYGVTGWTGKDGELDHRVPLFLGGLTVEDNLWPQRGGIPNRKDRLEQVVRRRVCDGEPHPMRVRTAVRLFLADWRHAYAALVLAARPAVRRS